MVIELLQRLSLISYGLAVLFLILSIILFFRLKVPDLINELSGAAARKGVEEIRSRSEGGEAPRSTKRKNPERSHGNTVSESYRQSDVGYTSVTGEMPYAPVSPAQETTLLQGQETTLLQAQESSGGISYGETEPLSVSTKSENETTRLYGQESGSVDTLNAENAGYSTIDVEIGFIGSNELIE